MVASVYRALLFVVPVICVALGMVFPQSLFQRCGGPSLLFLHVQLCLGLGDRLLARFFPELKRNLSLTLGLQLAFGWAVLSLGLQVLAVIGCYEPISLLIFLTTAIVLSQQRGTAVDVWSQLLSWLRSIRLPTKPRVYRYSILMTFAVIGMTFLWAWGPVWDYDSEAYHLAGAKEFIKSHGLTTFAENPPLNYPLLGSLWSGLGLLVNQPSYAALQMWLAAVGTSLLAHGYAKRWIGQWCAAWSVPVFWSGAVVSMVAATPRVEPLYTLFVFAAVCLLTEAYWFQQRLTVSFGISVGMFLGLAACLKYQALYAWVVIAVWGGLRWVFVTKLRTLGNLSAGALLFLVAIAVTSPWWLKNFWAFQNPFYPFLNPIDRPSPWWSTRMMTGPIVEITQSQSHSQRVPNFLEMFLAPDRWSGPPWHLPHYSFLLIVCLPFYRVSRRIWEITLLGLSLALLAACMAPVQRHLFAAYPLLAIGVAGILSSMPRCSRFNMIRWVVPCSLYLACVVPGRILHLPDLGRYLLTIDSREALPRKLQPGYIDAIGWLNQNAAPHSQVLQCWEMRTFRLDQPALIDPGGRNWFVLFSSNRSTAQEVTEFLDSINVEYILIHEGTLRYQLQINQNVNVQLAQEYQRELEILLAGGFDQVFEHQGVRILKVPESSIPPSELSSTTRAIRLCKKACHLAHFRK